MSTQIGPFTFSDYELASIRCEKDRIAQIRRIRALTGCGLREARDVSYTITPSQRQATIPEKARALCNQIISQAHANHASGNRLPCKPCEWCVKDAEELLALLGDKP